MKDLKWILKIHTYNHIYLSWFKYGCANKTPITFLSLKTRNRRNAYYGYREIMFCIQDFVVFNCWSEKWMTMLRILWDSYYLPLFFLRGDLLHISLHRIETRHTTQHSHVSSVHWLPTIWKLRHNNSPSTGDTEMPVDKCIQSQHSFFHRGHFLK